MADSTFLGDELTDDDGFVNDDGSKTEYSQSIDSSSNQGGNADGRTFSTLTNDEPAKITHVKVKCPGCIEER